MGGRNLFVAEVSFRVRYMYVALFVRSLRIIGVNLYRRRTLPESLREKGVPSSLAR